MHRAHTATRAPRHRSPFEPRCHVDSNKVASRPSPKYSSAICSIRLASSSAGASNTTRPRCRRYTRSANSTARAAFCSARTIVWPCSRRSARKLKTSSTICGARPSEGSSSRSRRGRATSARASASCCCSPPESCPAQSWRRSLRTGKRSRTVPTSVLGGLAALRAFRPRRRFSSTVSEPKIRLPGRARSPDVLRARV